MQIPYLVEMDYKELIKEIIEKSYNILLAQISKGRIIIDNEASFQLQFSYILKVIGELHQFSPDDLFSIRLETPFLSEVELAKSKSKRAKIDITVTMENRLQKETKVSCTIELKYFQWANHREPNNRYDAFNDLLNLEEYVYSNQYNFGVFIIGTDHLHYVNQDNYSENTRDFDMRDGKTYKAGSLLEYKTMNPYGPAIQLKNDYVFSWENINQKYFLKLLIEQ
ncbi:hypothetical protein BGM26_04540 [Bacillus sp. FJAT-29790]|uniref:hypothetical protein n=1 Tax=Bacillus sp. FJAT-29790 TaxID=1895002 RepID=UPI001C237360|nr:hypothetical protein [Bacillus sp. FJAT-29790]MBU8878255.1 hypothetical protein [Bacillus sp. FJAT-29790]